MGYQDDLYAWRVQRRQQEAQSRLQELRQEHAEAVRERDTAVANNDLETAAGADDQGQYLENEYRRLPGPQRTQVHPEWTKFCSAIPSLSSARASGACKP